MTDQKRILWLTPDKPDNISVGRQRIANHLEERGFAVTLRGTTIRTVLQSLRERGTYDAVIGTTRAGAFAGVLLKLVQQRPLIVDHVDPIQQFDETHPHWLAVIVRLFENVSFWYANSVLYVYTEEFERVSRYTAMAKRTDLGVEYDRFADPEPDILAEAADTIESLDLNDRVAIYIGGLEPIYHIRSLLDAIGHLDGWSLLVLGDGSLAEYVQNKSTGRDDLVYVGTVPHEIVSGYLHAADVGVSLVNDPHTLKVLEYGAAGLSVVQISGRAEERFEDYVEYCDNTSESIAEAIERANSRNSTKPLRSYVSEFDWADIARDYNQALKSII